MALASLLALLALAFAPARSIALPAGRTWSAVDSLGSSFTSVRIVTDSSGAPALTAAYVPDSTTTPREWLACTWRGSHFTPIARLSAAGAVSSPEPILGPRAANGLLWLSHERDDQGAGRLLWAEHEGARFASPDTVMTAWLQSSESAGARGPNRTWVARCEQRFPAHETFGLRVRYRDARGRRGGWRELPERGVNEFTCTIAPLGDEAIVVYAGESGLAWLRTKGTAWGDSGRLDVRPWTAAHPRLRVESDGSLSLLWTTKEWVHLARYRAGRWTIGDSLRATHSDGGTYWAGWCDVSREAGLAMALAWGDRGYGATNRDVLCVAVSDSGAPSPGEEVPGTDGAFIPTVARDRNGDVWLAWSHLDRPGVFVAHTYVTATCDSPRVTRVNGMDRVRWTLSESASGSFWIVERTGTDSPFAKIGRVRAGVARELEWSGRAAVASARYRIRRDSVDERTAWTSAESFVWQYDGQRLDSGHSVPVSPGGR